MPGGERDDGLSPVCHPTPCPPAVAPPLCPTKKTKDISVTKKQRGGGGDCDGAFVSNAAYLPLTHHQVRDKRTNKHVKQHIVVF